MNLSVHGRFCRVSGRSTCTCSCSNTRRGPEATRSTSPGRKAYRPSKPLSAVMLRIRGARVRLAWNRLRAGEAGKNRGKEVCSLGLR